MGNDLDDKLRALAEQIEAGETADVHHLDKLPVLDVVNATELQGKPVKPREWLIDDWLPAGCVTSLYGDGGVGKSLAALQAGTAIATGSPLFSMSTTKAPVLGVFCEDHRDEIHRRQAAICRCEGLQFKNLESLHWVSRCGDENNLIATREKDGSIVRTGLFYAVRQKATDLGARLIMLDNIAHIYPGDENNRGETTQFINILNDLAQTINGAVLLVGHTPKNDAEYSGSTGWNNAVRSRWFFARPKPETGGDLAEDDDSFIDQRILRRGKSNYGRMDEEIALTWDDGAFKLALFGGRAMTVSTMETKMRERQVERAFLAELDERNDQLRPVSASPNSPKSYAPKVFVTTKRFKELKASRLEIEQGMERLFIAHEILARGQIGTSTETRNKVFGVVKNRQNEESDDVD